MEKKFAYTLIADWVRPAGSTVPGVDDLEPHEKLLLLSDGSLTVELELVYGSAVEVELVYRGFTTLSPDESDFLVEDQENESVEREVWLTVGGRRLVFARTLIPLVSLDRGLMKTLDESSSEPIGRVLNTLKIPFRKEGLEVAVVRCAPAAEALEIDPDTPMTARRYLLTNTEFGTRPVIKAVVTEVFNPEVVPASALLNARP